MKRLGLLVLTLATLIVLIPILLREAPKARAGTPVEVTLTITRIQNVHCDEEVGEACENDYYPKFDIDGQGLFDGKDEFCCAHGTDIEPNWVFRRNVDSDRNLVAIHIELHDQDDLSADDHLDIANGGDSLDLTYNLNNCIFTGGGLTERQGGDVPAVPGTSQGTPDDAARIFFTITTPFCTDSDGDGLMDGWETNGSGFDGNGNGFNPSDPNDLNLFAMGARKDHKDLFLELDSVNGQTPSKASIQAMKAAFAAAPISAGSAAASAPPAGSTAGEDGAGGSSCTNKIDDGAADPALSDGVADRLDPDCIPTLGINAPANPDGQLGINLWVDVGKIRDTDATVVRSEDGAPLGSCIDTSDNGGDGVLDANDPDCIPATEDGGAANSCNDSIDNGGGDGADAADPDCLVGDLLGGNNIGGNIVATPAGCLDSTFLTTKTNNFNANRRFIFRYAISGDPMFSSPCAGGQGEIGGNDFIEYNHDGGTIMHEFGHNLNLRHGGNDNNNCEPNYVSVMNYDHQLRIRQAGGGIILDYSPPRFTGGRGAAPLGNLVENSLNETTILDTTDAANRFVFVNGVGQKIQVHLDQRADWDGDGTPNETSVPPVNLNTSVGGSPGRCTNPLNSETLTGFHDWNSISLPFRQFSDFASGAVNPDPDRHPTLDELFQLEQMLNTTNMAITKRDDPDPAVAGKEMKYTLNIKNNGPNPSSNVQVVDTLPAGVSYQSDNGGCVQGPVGTLTCNLGELLVGRGRQSKLIHVTVLVAADLVHNAGAPTIITNKATVDNLSGPDSNSSDDSASETTGVVAVADLTILSFAPLAPPQEILVGQSVDITMRKIVTNKGPSAPMDVKLTKMATAPSDATITPTSATENALTVGLNEQRVVDEVFTVQCNGAGSNTFDFTNDIQPLRPDDTDPNLGNNHAEAQLEVTCVVPR